MVEGLAAGEVQRRTADLLGNGVGRQAQHRQRHGRQTQGNDRRRFTPLFTVFLALLPEDGHIDLGEIRRRQSAGEQEQPLHHGDERRAAHVGVFHQRLMHQRLAEIAQEARNTRQRAGAAQEQHMQQRLAPAEALDVVQIQRVGVVVHHTGEEEQCQLHQRVVHHVQHRAVGGQRVMLSQQAQHRRTHGDKADLGQGGAGQNVLQVGGEHRQHRAQHHGDSAQYKQQHAPAVVARQYLTGQQQYAEDTGLGQHAAQQGGSGSGRHRMCLGQPDMHREQASLGGKAEQDAQGGGPQPATLHGGHSIMKLRDHQCAGGVIQQEQAHQRHQTAQHRDGQVGLTGVHGVGGLLLHHPHIGAEGHQLEEQEGGVQVGGQEHARREAQADQEEEIVPFQVMVSMEILRAQQG